uniref:Phosphatidate cytidylyltransferase, mitochondrial n=1 Tax=Panagrolaimus sp. JU765 TaxID=591449 RepID=A0AC34RBV5_9BILA
MPLEVYKELIECLPLKTVVFAFAYGSGAISQADENLADKMVDFIVVTNDSLQFHQENLQKNPKHYSFIRLFGPERITKFQINGGGCCFFNTNVSYHGRLLKYGIISTNDLQEDLLDWSWLYVAGRLQKPVLKVIAPSESIKMQIKENRISAIQAACLQLPDSFTTEQLFEKIVSLSYNGDFRMHIGEDRKKISKIVSGGYEHLERIYMPLLTQDSRLYIKGNRIDQDNSTPSIYHRLNLLPLKVLNGLQHRSKVWDKRQRDIEEMLFSISHRHDVGDHVAATLANIVWSSSLTQTTKNAITAGFIKSIVYSSKKIFKMFKSIR